MEKWMDSTKTEIVFTAIWNKMNKCANVRLKTRVAKLETEGTKK